MKKFRTIYYEIGEKKKKSPLVFAHLSDLHGSAYGENQEGLFNALKKIQPDAVMVSGDMITPKEAVNEKTLAFFRKLAAEYPVFFANGNHETKCRICPEKYGEVYDPFLEELLDAGVYCLNNDSMYWEKKGRVFQIVGYEGDMSYFGRFSRKKLSVEELTGLVGKADKRAETILLAHNPMHFPTYKAWGADLTFSGHLHGGYIRLPFIGGVISPQVQLFPKYDRGLFEEEGRYLCVSAGLGDHSIAPRFLNPAELPVAVWY